MGGASRRQIARAACGLWLLFSCHFLFAIDPDRRVDQLLHTGWTAKDGAPGDIRALAQTTDGYLWIGSSSGLFRFDGIHFDRYKATADLPLPQRAITSLMAAPSGGLWIGFGSGHIGFLKNGALKVYGASDGLGTHSVLAFVRDRKDVVWAALGVDGLARLQGSRWHRIGEDWNFSEIAYSLFEDRDGALWVGTVRKLYVLRPGAARFEIVTDHLGYITRLVQATNGTIWMSETGRSVHRVVRSGQGVADYGAEVAVGSRDILIDNQGSLWVTSLGDGLRRVPNPERGSLPPAKTFTTPIESFTRKDGLTGDYMMCIMQDREGNVWTGTNAGLDRFRQSPLVPVALPPDGPVSALVEGEDNVVWAAIQPNRPLQRIQGGVATPVPGNFVHIDAAYRDPSGVVWLGNPFLVARFADETRHPVDFAAEHFRQTTGPMERLPGGAVVRPVDLPESVLTYDSRVRALTRDSTGRLWLSIAERGVFRLDGTTWTTLESMGGPKGSASAELTDSRGQVWFGFGDDTIVRLTGSQLRTFTHRDGLRVGNVLSLAGSGDGLWVGGDRGLAYGRDGRFLPVTAAGGAAFPGATGIVENAGLWLNGSQGIVHIPEAEIRAFLRDPHHAVSFEIFDYLDGLPPERQKPLTSNSAIRTADGLLWFATSGGIVWANPRRLARNALAPPVSIESITANGHSYDPFQSIELPPRTSRLVIAYAGLSLAVPERVRFRYQMEGADEGWQDAGTRREASYNNLGPGHYRFRVAACNNDGVWNEAGAALHFTIAPAYYQTWWFRTLCGVAAAGVLWLLYLLRLRQLTAQIQGRIGERLAERERIARELHDTLLQGVQGVMLHFDAAMRQLPPDAPVRTTMAQALRIADGVILEGRDRVRELRSEGESTADLPARLSACVKGLPGHHSVSFHLAVIGSVRPLDPIVHDEVYRIGREALVNAFRHARARSIEVEVTYDRTELRLRVRDDGQGIDQETLNKGAPGHWGLSGMRERAGKLGGQTNLWSRPGAGTEIDVTIPAPVAYRRSPGSSPARWTRWALFWRNHG